MGSVSPGIKSLNEGRDARGEVKGRGMGTWRSVLMASLEVK